MSEVRPTYDDEIDLFEIIETLWDGKWKIIVITFVMAVIGVIFSVVKPHSYEVSTPIQIGKQLAFIKYTPLNDILKNEGMLHEKETNPNGHIFDNASVFKMFVTEFKDYEEMVDVVGTSEFVQKSIKDLDGEDKQRALIDFAKSFKLNVPLKDEENWTLSFVWHDHLEGGRLFNDAIRQTLLNTKNIFIVNVNEFGKAVDVRNKRNLEKLRNKLNLITENLNYEDKKLIQYLIEQSAIAKELGIETNELNTNAISQNSQNAISFSVNSNNFPFYMRGYRAIDKEILLIQSRSDEERLLTANGYIETKEEILSLETDLLLSHLRKTSETIANDSPNDWVEFDFALADVKSQKKSMLYVALCIVLGGIVGAFYVLISNAIRKRKEQLVKA